MKKSIYIVSAIIIALLSCFACNNDVALPKAMLRVDYDSIKAPSIESVIQLNIEANCDWSLSFENDGEKWVHVAELEGIGSGCIKLVIRANDSDNERITVLRFSNRSGSAVDEIVLTQRPALSDGYISISEIRSLAAEGSYTYGKTDCCLKGIVVSNQQNGNFFDNTIALIGSSEPGNGITVRTPGVLFVSPGEEVEFNLSGATVGRSSVTGQMEIIPAEEVAVVRTESTKITPSAISVNVADVLAGKYESMLVQLSAQVSVNDLGKDKIAGIIAMQNENKEFFNMAVLPHSSLASESVPVGSGSLVGIVTYYNGEYCIAPRSADDIAMFNPRYDVGITYPYVLSFMTENANSKGRYIDFYKNDSDINSSYIMTKDGTGVTMKLNLSSAGTNQINFLFWADDSGHHNLQLGTFADGPKNDVIFVFPLDEDLSDGFRIQCGWGVQKSGIANWAVEYSVDGTQWYKIGEPDVPTFTIPSGKPYGSGKNFFNFTFDVETPAMNPERGQTLYIKFRPMDRASIGGGNVSATGSYGRATAHSSIIIDRLPSFNTTKPVGTLWFQPFDNLTEGADYRLGEKLCGLLNYCGSDITVWEVAQKFGMSGVNVRQRPGYAQIGYVESVLTDHKSLKNSKGELCTPVVGVSGDFIVSFDAMAYKNTSVFDKGNNSSRDINGDSRKAVIEVVGGGSIDGSEIKIIDNLSYTDFQNYSVTVENATPFTFLRFTSLDDDSEFTRWFIDNISVKLK